MSVSIKYRITRFGDRLDQICVDRYGSSHDDIVIFVFNQNPGLERFGIILPDSFKIYLPDLPVQSDLITVRVGQLPWV